MRQKKLTRREKINLTKNGICWKCNSQLVRDGKNLVCPTCGFQPPS